MQLKKRPFMVSGVHVRCWAEFPDTEPPTIEVHFVADRPVLDNGITFEEVVRAYGKGEGWEVLSVRDDGCEVVLRIVCTAEAAASAALKLLGDTLGLSGGVAGGGLASC